MYSKMVVLVVVEVLSWTLIGFISPKVFVKSRGLYKTLFGFSVELVLYGKYRSKSQTRLLYFALYEGLN